MYLCPLPENLRGRLVFIFTIFVDAKEESSIFCRQEKVYCIGEATKRSVNFLFLVQWDWLFEFSKNIRFFIYLYIYLFVDVGDLLMITKAVKATDIFFSVTCSGMQLRCQDLFSRTVCWYWYEFVNIVCKICIYYLFLNYNISDAREIFIFCEKSRDFS